MINKDKHPRDDLFPFSPYGPKPEGTHPLDPTYTSFDSNNESDEDDNINIDKILKR